MPPYPLGLVQQQVRGSDWRCAREAAGHAWDMQARNAEFRVELHSKGKHCRQRVGGNVCFNARTRGSCRPERGALRKVWQKTTLCTNSTCRGTRLAATARALSVSLFVATFVCKTSTCPTITLTKHQQWCLLLASALTPHCGLCDWTSTRSGT